MPGDRASDPSERLDPFASEERVRALVEQLPVVVYVDTDDRWARSLYLSPKVRDLLGYPPEAYFRDPLLWSRSMHEEDRAWVRELGDRSWEEGSPFRAEYRMIRPDGREVWLRDSCVLMTGPEGGRLAWQGVIEDITAEKRSEQEIRASEARYRALIERVPAVVYEMGPDDERRTLFVSPHVEEVLGYSRAEWLDQPDIWIELLHADDREQVLARHDAHSLSGEPWDLEYRLIASDGRVVWVNDRATLIREADDRSAAWHGVMLDVTAEREAREMLLLTKQDLERNVAERTAALEEANELMTLEIGERRRMEDELREARERSRQLIENMPGIAYVWEVDGGPRRFTYVSPRVQDVLGFLPDEWNAAARVHPHDRRAVEAAAEHTARTGAPFRMEYRCLAKDGRIVWVLDHASLFSRTEDGLPRAFQGVMLDITPRKAAESKAEQAEDRFRALTEEGPVVAFSYELVRDEVGVLSGIRLRYVSPQLAELAGYPLDEVTRDPTRWLDLIHPDDRRHVAEQVDRTWRTGEGWAIRYRLIRSDGGIVWLHDTGRMLERDPEGRPSRFQGVLLDVTSEHEQLLRIEAAEAKQREALTGAHVVPWTETVDTETGAVHYIYIGPQSLALFGYTPEELMVEREHFRRMVHPDDRERVEALEARSRETGVWASEYRVIRRDGEIRWIHSFGRRISPDGATPELWHGVAVDVTPIHEDGLEQQTAGADPRTAGS